MNSINVNLHSYYNNFANLHIFNLNNVSDFGNLTCKIDTFFYFVLINANALESRIGGGNRLWLSLFLIAFNTQHRWPDPKTTHIIGLNLYWPNPVKKKKKKPLIRPNCPNPFKLPNHNNWKTKPRPTLSPLHFYTLVFLLLFAMCKRFYGSTVGILQSNENDFQCDLICMCIHTRIKV